MSFAVNLNFEVCASDVIIEQTRSKKIKYFMGQVGLTTSLKFKIQNSKPARPKRFEWADSKFLIPETRAGQIFRLFSRGLPGYFMV